MSENKEGQQQVISVEQLLNEVERIRRSIDTLQSAILEVNDSISAIASSKKVLEITKSQNQIEALVTVDKKGYLIQRINGIASNKVLVRLGSKYYAEVDIDTALRILEKREEELKRVSQSLQGELAKQLQYYNQLVEILNQIQTQLQQRGE
ncbi:MAG: prefoldin subunit alpha [Sulfolobaceae archaeon]